MGFSRQTVEDINLVSCFLAKQDVSDFTKKTSAVDAIVICASEVLFQAESLFQVLTEHPSITKTLVLCGGIGHSTSLIYDAVARHSRFSPLAKGIHGLPEARVLEHILNQYFDPSAFTTQGCRILIEDQSTNCGANAIKSRKVLDEAGLLNPKRLLIVQDPTMAMRTVASFQKAYDDLDTPPEILSWPVFVPELMLDAVTNEPVFSIPIGISSKEELWKTSRFLDLILGEIPRLKDNASGYGPKGAGYIVHVDVPCLVEEACARVKVDTSDYRAEMSRQNQTQPR